MPIQFDPALTHKTFEIKILDKRKDGGRIVINTAAADRDSDHVFPAGGRFDNYLKNPVVQWGHNYKDPFATIGRTLTLIRAADGLVADFELRPAANEADPQNIVRLLWDGEWIKTSSIGFIPLAGKPNNIGGHDYTEWELLEWSLVPIPSNAEALRLAVKSLEIPHYALGGLVAPAALPIVIVASNKDALLATSETGSSEMPAASVSPTDEPAAPEPIARAWLRRFTVETDQHQELFACFMQNAISVPADATLLQMDFTLGECREVPHPEAGQTVTFKTVMFTPPLLLADGDAVYAIERRDCSDNDLLAADYWKSIELSEVLATLPPVEIVKGWQVHATGLPIDIVTRKSLASAVKMLKALQHRQAAHLSADASPQATVDRGAGDPIELAAAPDTLQTKRGRVLSATNESKLKSAQQDAQSAADKVGEVLKQVEAETVTDAVSTVLTHEAGEPLTVALSPAAETLFSKPVNEGEQPDVKELSALLIELRQIVMEAYAK